MQRLCAGDTFFEPANEIVAKFDATEEGVTFLGWFPLAAGERPEITMLEG